MHYWIVLLGAVATYSALFAPLTMGGIHIHTPYSYSYPLGWMDPQYEYEGHSGFTVHP